MYNQDEIEDKYPILKHLHKIIVGKEYSYIDLCMALEQPKTTGNSKISQLKEIQRYMNIEKNGRRYVVREKYQKILPKNDNRTVVKPEDGRHKGNNSKYFEPLEKLIINSLFDAATKNVEITYLGLLEKIGITNYSLYYEAEYFEKSEFYSEYDITLSLCYAQDRISSTVFRTLNKMRTDGTIGFSESYHYKSFTLWHEANIDEVAYIKATKKAILKETGYKNLFILKVKNEFEDYLGKCNEKFADDYGWEGVYKSYYITLKKPFVKLPNAELLKYKKELVTMLKEMLITDAENRYNKSIAQDARTILMVTGEELLEKINKGENYTLEDFMNGVESKVKLPYLLPWDFPQKQRKIIDLVFNSFDDT